MGDNKVYYELFNKKSEEFIKELMDAFPYIKQFGTFKSGFNFLKTLDARKPQSVFHNYVYKEYKEPLLQKNEKFFLTNEYDLTDAPKDDNWIDFIENIRAIWKILDAENKEAIWKHFHVLIALNEKCVNTA